MNIWHDIDAKRMTTEDFEAVVEISKYSKNKYELDKETGMLKLDRILYTSTHYPANYGFLPLTYAEDNDPLDVLILGSEAITPMTLVRCYPIGHLSLIDQGEEDIKILAIPFQDPTWNCYKDVDDLPPHIMAEIKHFFHVYKELEGKEIEVLEVYHVDAAKKVIQDSLDDYTKLFIKNKKNKKKKK